MYFESSNSFSLSCFTDNVFKANKQTLKRSRFLVIN